MLSSETITAVPVRYNNEEICEIFQRPATALHECPASQYFFTCIVNRSGTFCPSSEPMVQYFDKRVARTYHEIWHSFWTIMPVLYWFSLAYVLARRMFQLDGSSKISLQRFLIEFVIIALPMVLCVNVYNYLVEYIVLTFSAALMFFIYRTRCLNRVADYQANDLGGYRLRMLTLSRATINILTALCILAIDFENFPKCFRKSRYFGAGLMDTGIGLFAFAMGSVSRRLRNINSFVHLLRQVVPVLLLGVARTLVIMAIDYHQDEHEYGMHLNAFFTLGLTKLFGSVLSTITATDMQLLFCGIVVTISQECVLQLGMSEFVMHKNLKRNTFLRANREGICSLPGFIGIYMISMFIGQWLQTNKMLTGKQLLQKLKLMILLSGGLWLLLVICLPLVGVARVTCNLGYTLWILAIALTMTSLFMFVFDIVLPTIFNAKETIENSDKMELCATKSIDIYETGVPILVEAVNYNGLIYFLIANILTGQVNLFLKPETRSSIESVAILVVYMLICMLIVFVMHVLRIKIG